MYSSRHPAARDTARNYHPVSSNPAGTLDGVDGRSSNLAEAAGGKYAPAAVIARQSRPQQGKCKDPFCVTSLRAQQTVITMRVSKGGGGKRRA
jgi:hypothetical protein